MKLIVNEESEPRLKLGRYEAVEHLRQSHVAPLLLLLANKRNGAESSGTVTTLLRPRKSLLARADPLGAPASTLAAESWEPSANPQAADANLPASELDKLKAQLGQAQRMAAIGKLAGGVTHDLNNLLMVMSTHSEIALAKVADPDAKRRLQLVLDAIQRASTLIRQLLGFGREHAAQPQVLSLNGVVRDLEQLLLCLVGKDIEVTVKLDEQLDLCNVDSVQTQQILVNLVVNARDAMPDGGQLRIETENAEVRPGGPASVPAGRYVALTVRDTGMGMDQKTREHIFEPFFTTKKLGQGTGLGLSTVYDIVKHSGGYVSVESEIGLGTAFRIYLPAVAGFVV